MNKAQQRLQELIDEHSIEKVVSFIEVRVKQLQRARDPEVRVKALARARERRNADKIELQSLRERVKGLKADRESARNSA